MLGIEHMSEYLLGKLSVLCLNTVQLFMQSVDCIVIP